MATAVTNRAVLRVYDTVPKEVCSYFPHFRDLISRFPWNVVVSYVFSRVEYAKHMTIYCGIVKLHQTDADLTWKAVERDYLSRFRFKELFQTVFAKKIKADLLRKLEEAEDVRDKVVHGKQITPAEIRQAMVHLLQFARDFNDFVFSIAQFRPFGHLRGFKGRAKGLPKSTTRWILKGMGFAID